ncbi:type VI secretion protein [Bradyrhizobium sediminis]|uniref:Type VI secretion protein n=1 Tax=Bradyrhizobium sediminis TaxID=2840469 RepID=A0A975RVT0_9BRAD|nr:type VI secretion protein [Bradyrhizobium sediminis]QWG21373.1 type VI secretion protein [Bradyrhizobium sediminis]
MRSIIAFRPAMSKPSHLAGFCFRQIDFELISLLRPDLAGWGIDVKFIAVLTVLCTFSGAAIAQGSPCQSIAKASDRLACYDKAAPPIALAKPAASKTPAAPAKLAISQTSTEQQGHVVDLLAAENAKLDAKLKTICRGC